MNTIRRGRHDDIMYERSRLSRLLFQWATGNQRGRK